MKVINSLWKRLAKEYTSTVFLEGIPIFLLIVTDKNGNYAPSCKICDVQTKLTMFSQRVGGDADGKNVLAIEVPKLFGKMYSEIDTTFTFTSDNESVYWID
jgi:hypothetical protein